MNYLYNGIGSVLLDNTYNFYLDEEGNLPNRPNWDKQFLIDLVWDKYIVCSDNTYNDLPTSIKKITTRLTKEQDIYMLNHINLGIKTFKEYPPFMLYIVRSEQVLTAGKRWQKDWLLNNYRLQNKIRGVELWIHL